MIGNIHKVYQVVFGIFIIYCTKIACKMIWWRPRIKIHISNAQM